MNSSTSEYGVVSPATHYFQTRRDHGGRGLRAASVQCPTKATLRLCARSLTNILKVPVSRHKTDDSGLGFMQLLVTNQTYVMPYDSSVSK
jgi:hypothetical protein